MKAASRVATVLVTAATVAVVCGGWGSAMSSPADAPAPASLTTAADGSGRAAGGRATGDVFLLASQSLPQGLALPSGVRPASTARTFARGELRGWETTVDLGPVAVTTVMRSLRDDLTAQGFQLSGGSHDVFGMRQRHGRWEIVVARVEHHGRADAQRDVLTVGIGSRPA